MAAKKSGLGKGLSSLFSENAILDEGSAVKLKINEIDYVASITKTCAPSTYLFRDNEIKEIDSFSLPVGIVEDVEAYDNVINIQKEDIFIMSSDGFKLTKEEIKDFLLLNQDLPSQQLCEKLISVSKKDVVTDDVTLFVIKVI